MGPIPAAASARKAHPPHVREILPSAAAYSPIMGSVLRRLLSSSAPSATILVRIAVGAVFLSEGVLKFFNPAEDGAGRFAKIGLPAPEFLAPFVGTFEIACGLLVVAGLLTRLASVPLLAVISTAIATTKIPMLLKDGFWKFAHESRTDFAMLLGLLFLLSVGAGRLSLDARLADRPETKPVAEP